MFSFIPKGKHCHWLDWVAEANGILSGIALYPQLFSTLSTFDVAGLSFWTFFLIALNSIIWIVYAVHRKLPPLFVSSVLNFIASVILMGLIILY